MKPFYFSLKPKKEVGNEIFEIGFFRLYLGYYGSRRSYLKLLAKNGITPYSSALPHGWYFGWTDQNEACVQNFFKGILSFLTGK